MRKQRHRKSRKSITGNAPTSEQAIEKRVADLAAKTMAVELEMLARSKKIKRANLSEQELQLRLCGTKGRRSRIFLPVEM